MYNVVREGKEVKNGKAKGGKGRMYYAILAHCVDLMIKCIYSKSSK
jgi:hypothetical protein